jgi:hypothetical protein
LGIFRTGLSVLALGAGLGLSVAPASAQLREQLQQLQEMINPTQAQDPYRDRRDPYRGAPPQEYRGQPPADRGPPGPPGRYQDGADDPRARMMELREACQDGDRRACIRFGIIIGENRERRAQWRREHPDMFWWER